MKKLLALFLIVTVLFCMGIPVMAFVPETEPVIPMWDNILSAAPVLLFSGTNGYASAKITAQSGSTEINASLAVYKQVGNDWVYVDHDSGRTTSGLLYALSLDFQGEPGAYYKAVLNVTVTKNGISENAIKFAYATCPQGTCAI